MWRFSLPCVPEAVISRRIHLRKKPFGQASSLFVKRAKSLRSEFPDIRLFYNSEVLEEKKKIWKLNISVFRVNKVGSRGRFTLFGSPEFFVDSFCFFFVNSSASTVDDCVTVFRRHFAIRFTERHFLGEIWLDTDVLSGLWVVCLEREPPNLPPVSCKWTFTEKLTWVFAIQKQTNISLGLFF